MTNLTGISFININKICRICLVECTSSTSIFSKLCESENISDVSTLAEEITKITSVPINSCDGLPSIVCWTCITLIHEAYKFKIQFDNSTNLLQKYLLESQVTKEDADIEHNDVDSGDDDKAVDYYIDSIAQSLTEKLGKRQTSRKQIEKRECKSKYIKRVITRKKTRNSKLKSDKEEKSDVEKNLETELPILHPCPICTQEFTSLQLREHAHTHKALKRYLSINNVHKILPSTRFYKKYDLENLVVSIHNRTLKIHKCVLCNSEFDAINFRTHLETHRNQKEYKCDQCERIFKKLNHLNTHRVKHLKEFPFKCKKCNKGFVIQTNYDCHVLTHNANQELPHECTHCLKRFSNPEHLNRHLIIHTENVSYSVKYRVCKCHHCLKTFKDREELRAHVCVPIPQAVNTKFPCKSCNKIFKNSSGLYNHNRNIHKLKGAKTLCSVCGNYVSNIYNHMMRHTGEKPFQCNQCGKRFIGKPQLRQHLLVHSGLKPFVCSICAKAFNNLYNLQVHERIHIGDRCHICNICNKGFLEKSYLKKHMNVHTKL